MAAKCGSNAIEIAWWTTVIEYRDLEDRYLVVGDSPEQKCRTRRFSCALSGAVSTPVGVLQTI